jgi:O-antigen ligase
MSEDSSARRVVDLVLPAAAFTLPVLGVFAPLGAAPLLVTAAIAALVLGRQRFGAALGALAILVGLLAVLGLWATLSGLWSIIPRHSAFEGLRFLAEGACGLVLLSTGLSTGSVERRRIAQAMVAGALLALMLLAIERFGGEPIMRWWHGVSAAQGEPLGRYDRGVTMLALLIWPIVVADLTAGWRILLVASIVVTTMLMASAAALLAAVVGLAVFALARFVPRFAAGGMIAGMIALGIAIPLATPSYSAVLSLHAHAPWIKWSGIHRLLIWRFAADRVAERPVLGWGMDASRAVPGGTADFNDLLPTLHYPNPAEALPLHPHDAALQWQLELGIPGLLLGLAVVAIVIHSIGWRARLSPHDRAAALALAAASLVIGLLSFGIWQSWWVSTLWLTASFFAGARASDGA